MLAMLPLSHEREPAAPHASTTPHARGMRNRHKVYPHSKRFLRPQPPSLALTPYPPLSGGATLRGAVPVWTPHASFHRDANGSAGASPQCACEGADKAG